MVRHGEISASYKELRFSLELVVLSTACCPFECGAEHSQSRGQYAKKPQFCFAEGVLLPGTGNLLNVDRYGMFQWHFDGSSSPCIWHSQSRTAFTLFNNSFFLFLSY